MNIAITGYGRMGREVEQAALQRGHKIVSTIDPQSGSYAELSEQAVANAEGIIEFGLPGGILDRIQFAADKNIPLVIGTTGWDDHIEEARALVQSQSASLLYGSNFSIGANLFFKIVSQAAALINNFDDYDIMIHEYHHSRKKDSPSGTALNIANIILDKNKKKNKICTEPLQREISPGELHLSSTRGGSIPGIHTITLDSPADSISLSHGARNRVGFAMGAVTGLEWLLSRQGFYNVEEFFNDVIDE